MTEQNRDLIIEKKTHTQKDFEILKELEKYFDSSLGTTNVKLSNFTKYVRSQDLLKFLGRYELFKKVLDVQGSIIECGVLFGGGLMAWAHFSAIFEPIAHSRKILGFDTFSGFPELSDVDKKSYSSYAKSGGMAVDSYDDLEKCIELYDAHRYINNITKVELIKGDVIETIPKYIEENPHLVVSLLYLDLDIYEPTKLAIEKLVPRMPKGAIIAFDELYSKNWPGETKAVLDTLGIRNLKIQKFPFNNYQSYVILE